MHGDATGIPLRFVFMSDFGVGWSGVSDISSLGWNGVTWGVRGVKWGGIGEGGGSRAERG